MEFSLLEDEKFDFDLPLSPEEEREGDDDEDEIFFGPVGHNERCVATNTETKSFKYLDEVEDAKPMGPLNPEQIVEIFKEATSIALMFKTSSSDTVPELISDVAEARRRALKADHRENGNETLENSKESSIEKMSDDDSGDKVVVRRRVLKERNSNLSSNVKKSPNLTTKAQIIKREQAASGQSKGSGSVSKLQKLKDKPKTSYQNSPLNVNKMLIYGVMEDGPESPANQKSVNVRKSSTLTPRKSSSTSSKAERSFSSNKSSSASDTSFTEETTKLSKLPMPSQSSLKAPGFSTSSDRRQRTTSSNSSVSSTSSTSSVSALNETFTVIRSSGSPSSTKQSKSNISLPNRPMLTKISISKPVFAKPNEILKSSRLQPMRTLQRAPAGTARSVSSMGTKSPAQIKTIPRAVSAGSTPLRAQTPKADGTPNKGMTPIRRRSIMNTSSSSITAKKRQSGIMPPNDTTKKPNTPQVRRNMPGIAGSVGKPKPDATSSSLIVKKKASGIMKAESQNKKLGKSRVTKKSTTPEIRTNIPVDKDLNTTPKNTGELRRNNCKKRRSFIPTPNRTVDYQPNLNRTVDSSPPKAPSPVPFTLSPASSQQSRKTQSNEENIEPVEQKSIKSSRNSEDENISQANISLSPESTSLIKAPENPISDLADTQSSGEVKTPESIPMNSDNVPRHVHVPDLMIQESPLQLGKVSLDDMVDPFSPGIPSPDLPIDGCLNPVVLQMDTKDLIDLTHMTPKQEADLIDLAADSPIYLVEAKLVDI